MQVLVQSLLFVLLIVPVALCWALVIAHRVDWQPFNVARYPSLQGSLYFAYTVSALSLALFALAVLLSLKK